MKPVKSNGKLKLNKETLRDLSHSELAVVNGASLDPGGTCPITPTTTTLTTSSLSTPQLGCTGTILTPTSPLINPKDG